MSASSWPELEQPLVEAELPVAAPRPVRWSAATRVAFRFAFAYLVLYNFPVVFAVVEFTAPIAAKIDEAWAAIVRPIARLVFGLEVQNLTNGSGDTLFNWVQVFAMAALSAVVAMVWTLVDRRRLNYEKLYAWLRVGVRWSLAFAMFGYGSYKVIKVQFPEATLDRLVQPLGDGSPMGLLWTFMGFSAAYNLFTGAAEMLGGLLLTARRTTLLGALITAGVMANVAVMNFTYDVPVKLYSSHLLLMALFLMLPDLRRLANVFVLNRTAEAVPLAPAHRWRWTPVARTLFVIAYCGYSIYGAQQFLHHVRVPRPSPLQGIWNVDELTENGVARPPLTTDTARWRRVVISNSRALSIYRMNDAKTRYAMEDDAAHRTLTLKEQGDAASKAMSLVYRRADPNTLVVTGAVNGKQIAATLHRDANRTFLLNTRGFHWISETPLNR